MDNETSNDNEPREPDGFAERFDKAEADVILTATALVMAYDNETVLMQHRTQAMKALLNPELTPNQRVGLQAKLAETEAKISVQRVNQNTGVFKIANAVHALRDLRKEQDAAALVPVHESDEPDVDSAPTEAPEVNVELPPVPAEDAPRKKKKKKKIKNGKKTKKVAQE
jgi:hypothetical protein